MKIKDLLKNIELPEIKITHCMTYPKDECGDYNHCLYRGTGEAKIAERCHILNQPLPEVNSVAEIDVEKACLAYCKDKDCFPMNCNERCKEDKYDVLMQIAESNCIKWRCEGNEIQDKR